MISAALLAGGKSRRMGRDKCLLEIDDIPLWQRQLTLLSEFSTNVAVIAPLRPDWCPPSAHWLPDRARDCGPLGGLDAALAGAQSPQLLVLAVDLPQITTACLESLVAQSTDVCGVVPVIDDLFQPFSAIYPLTALPIVQRHLSEPDKSLQRLLRELVAEGQMKACPSRLRIGTSSVI